MLRRYVAPAFVALLIAAWLGAIAWNFLYFKRSGKLAEDVARGTGSFRKELLEPRVDWIAAHAFPEGRVLGAVKLSWARGVKVGSYPFSLMRKAGGAAPKRGGR